MTITTTYLEIIINCACQKLNKFNLDPRLYREIENTLKTYCDGRYNLFVLAGTQDTAIIQYQDIKYYIYFNNTIKKFKVEKYN